MRSPRRGGAVTIDLFLAVASIGAIVLILAAIVRGHL